MADSNWSGEGRSINSVDAPIRSGNSRSPPRPKVKASGGLPVKMSSAPAPQHRRRPAVARGDQVAVEMHRCFGLAGCAGGEGDERRIVGRGVHVAKVAGLSAIRASSPSEAAPPKSTMLTSVGHCNRAHRARPRAGHRTTRAKLRPCATISTSSFARNIGIVPTAMPPAFSTPKKQAAYSGLFGARSSTRLPGTRPRSSTRTRAI